MYKITVIIPVYNVEKYLKECLDSIVNQLYTNLEIICINDSSTDRSPEILKDFASKDKRIKIIDLPSNKGVGTARNIGIDAASGDYIAFVDSDDLWEADTAETLIKNLDEKADIILFGYNNLTNNKLTQDKIINKLIGINNEEDYGKNFEDFVNVIWNKLYKTTFIKNNNIKFNTVIHPTEDVLFALEAFYYKPQLSFIPKALYNYRKDRDGSAMRNYAKLVLNQIQAVKELLNSGFFKNSNNEYKKLCIEKMFGGLIYFCFITTTKKYPASIYSSNLRELISYMENEFSKDFLMNCRYYEVLKNLSLKE